MAQPVNKTVLLAEDDQSIAELLLFWLRELNFKVVWATDGRQAVALALEHVPHLLVMDLQMPFVDGFEAARQIRQSEALRHSPIIFITAHGGKGIELFERVEALGDGQIEYVTKPIDFEYLRDLLTRLL